MPSHTTSAKAAAAASAEMIMDAVTNAGVPPDEAAVIGKHMMMQELRVTQLEADLQDTMRALQRLREYLTARDSMEGTE